MIFFYALMGVSRVYECDMNNKGFLSFQEDDEIYGRSFMRPIWWRKERKNIKLRGISSMIGEKEVFLCKFKLCLIYLMKKPLFYAL